MLQAEATTCAKAQRFECQKRGLCDWTQGMGGTWQVLKLQRWAESDCAGLQGLSEQVTMGQRPEGRERGREPGRHGKRLQLEGRARALRQEQAEGSWSRKDGGLEGSDWWGMGWGDGGTRRARGHCQQATVTWTVPK